MKITGIITEYNPFHNGHKLHLEKTKDICNSEGVISVMSGNFVQRGLPASIDKWTRAQMAVENGVDLVIELPTVYAVASAEFFSFGAISLLNELNIVDSICFGSECGDISLLQDIATILASEDEKFKNCIKEKLSQGLPFPKARQKALEEYMESYNYDKAYLNSVISSPNNILGIEYIKSLIKLKSKIRPYTIPRIGSGYNDEQATSTLASATSIRKILSSNDVNEVEKYMPENSIKILKKYIESGKMINTEEMMFNFIKYRLLSDFDDLRKIPDISEGLDNKIIKALNTSNNLNELILNSKSKRYTYSRISRVLCHFYLNFDKYNISELRKQTPSYVRILAFNNKGREILKQIKDNSNIPIITKLPKNIEDELLKIDINSTNLYSMLSNSIPLGADYLLSPFFKK